MATKQSSISIPDLSNTSCNEYLHYERLFESRSRSMTLSYASQVEDENGKELNDASSTRVNQNKKTKPKWKARRKVSDINSLKAEEGQFKQNSIKQTLKCFFAKKWNRESYNLQSFDFPVQEVTLLARRSQTRRKPVKEPSEKFQKIDNTTDKEAASVGELTCESECSKQKKIRRESSLMPVDEEFYDLLQKQKSLSNSHIIVYNITNCQSVQISGGGDCIIQKS